MTVIFPYSLPYFADLLPISGVEWSVKRRDRLSGQGSGRIWQAELADPLWIATVELDGGPSAEMKQHAARIRALRGAQEQFFLYDPLSQFPASDPSGAILGASAVQINSIGADRRSISFKGLPPGYVLTIADKAQIPYGSNPTRHAFLELSETGAAGSNGITAELGVFPNVGVGIAAGAAVILVRPACRMIIMPDTHMPGRARRHWTEGAGFTAIQKP